MKIFLHRLIALKDAKISVLDHGFLYGDGVYETVRTYEGHVFRWDAHVKRFRQSARLAEISFPWSSHYLLAAVNKVLKGNRLLNATVRLCASRGPGPLGLDPGRCPTPTLVVLPHAPTSFEVARKEGVTAVILKRERISVACLDPRIKSASALSLVLAKAEAQKRRAFEGLLLNSEGMVTEGTVSNCFFAKRGVLYTPASMCGLLPGITRAVILEFAQRENIRLVQGTYQASELFSADEVFLTNCTWEIMPIVRLTRERKLSVVGKGVPGPLTRRLQKLYQQEVAREADQPLL